MLELQAIIYPKEKFTKEQAITISQDMINNKTKSFIRETNQSWRFRNIQKQRFDKTTFRTKKLNNGIALIYGELLK